MRSGLFLAALANAFMAIPREEPICSIRPGVLRVVYVGTRCAEYGCRVPFRQTNVTDMNSPSEWLMGGGDCDEESPSAAALASVCAWPLSRMRDLGDLGGAAIYEIIEECRNILYVILPFYGFSVLRDYMCSTEQLWHFLVWGSQCLRLATGGFEVRRPEYDSPGTGGNPGS